MSLRTDVSAALGSAAFQPGLSALKAGDRALVSVKTTRLVKGSADIDKALRGGQPNAPRWDYMVGHGPDNSVRITWIEVHPASGSKNASEIERKLEWLLEWLHHGGHTLEKYQRDVVWVASGKSAFTARDPGIKRLASRGCRFVGSHLTISC